MKTGFIASSSFTSVGAARTSALNVKFQLFPNYARSAELLITETMPTY